MPEGVEQGRSIVRGLVAMVLVALSVALPAQVNVSVVDATSGEAIPFAHVAFNGVGSDRLEARITDQKGHAELPLAVTHEGAVIRISFVGYRTWVDTLRATAPITCRLQRDELDLHELVVTGQYAPGSVEGAVHRLRVIDAERIHRMAAQNLGDALRDQLNIRLAQDNVLGSSMSMRGLGGENVKVLVDGIPVTGRQNGNVDLSQIDLTGIERIEVVEGPLSVNYGTNALAGTINLITRKSGGAPASVKFSTYAESIGRLNTTVAATRRWGLNEVVLNAGRNFFGGWDPRESGLLIPETHVADTTRFQQWKPREQYFGRLNYRWRGERWSFGYKGEALHDRITDRGLPRAPYNETAFDARYLTLRLDNALFTEGRIGRSGRVQALAAHNRYSRTRNTWLRDLTTLGEELSAQPGMQDTARFTLTNVRATYAFTPDSTRCRYEVGADLNLETGAGDRIGNTQREIGDYAGFASAEYRPAPSLVIRPGMRYAYNTRYNAPLIPSINVRQQLGERFTLRASYAQGFRAPSLKELHLYFVDVNHDILGNPDLKAERSQSSSLGVCYRDPRASGTFTGEVSGFYNDVQDLITLAQLSGTHFIYANIGRLRTAGGSIGCGWENKQWITSAGATITYRKDDLAEAYTSAWSSTSEIRGSITRQWQRQGWSATFLWKYQGDQFNYMVGTDGLVQRGTIGDFHLADANVMKQLYGDRLALTAGCKDLFDVRNLNATGSSGIHSTGGSSVPMTTGRTFFLRVELALQQKGS